MRKSVWVLATVLALTASAKRKGPILSSPDLSNAASAANVEGLKKALDAGESIQGISATGQPLLNQVLQRGDKPDDQVLEATKLLLERGAALDATDYEGATALMVAARWGRVEAVELLLSHKAPVAQKDRAGQNVVHHVVAAPDEDAAVKILESLSRARAPLDVAETRRGKTPLYLAVGWSHLTVARWLLDHAVAVDAADQRGATPLLGACEQGALDAMALLLEHGANVRAAMKARDQGSCLHLLLGSRASSLEMLKGIQMLESKGLAVKDETRLPPILALAAGHGGVTVVKQLLDQGVDLQAQGPAALVQAAESSSREVMELLLERGVDPDAQDRAGQTALMAASAKPSPKELDWLLERSKKIDLQDHEGQTALMLASRARAVSTISALIARGARRDLKDRLGRTAEDFARENEALEVLALLEGPPPGTELDVLIASGSATEADARRSAQAWTEAILPKLKSSARISPGFPKVILSDQLPGLKPGFQLVVLGFCPVERTKGAVDTLRGWQEGLYARHVTSKATEPSCPSFLKQGSVTQTVAVTLPDRKKLRAVKLSAAPLSPGAPSASSVIVTLVDAEGRALDSHELEAEEPNGDIGSDCTAELKRLSASSIRLVRACTGGMANNCTHRDFEETYTVKVSGLTLSVKEASTQSSEPIQCAE